ncbi:CoA pyrophosphatase [Daeguia caeni]|uniref:CoA pyrophosphatase n=1 Tax=Daeguia caeni TaxID=439612 RepID=A0ABV9H730_9HYPH
MNRPSNLHKNAFSAAAFAERVRRWQPDHADLTGDHILNPEFLQTVTTGPMREAAVLIGVVDRGEEATVLLTQRTAHLRQHSGQISFPGGSIDPEDGSAENAALREADEEIGLAQDRADIVGYLPRYLTGSGFSITPILAVVRTPVELKPNPVEVADIFEVPLSFLMNPANHIRASRVLENGQKRYFYAMPYQERYIWGITAGIIRGLYERLYR